MIIHGGIKNIIFDWGGVIINIDYNRTRSAFIEMGLTDFDNHYTQFSQHEVFDKLDIGKISGDEFFSAIMKEMPAGTPEEKVRDAWNAMLLDFPEENYQLLKEVKKNYRSFLFSNTNEPHLDYYFKKVEKWYGISEMDPLFEKAYYSCRFGMRKPDPEAFERILAENNLNPSETLFIDDSIQHIEGARKTGIHAYHLQAPEKLTELFNGVM
jgi:putative hydrolase of the HAD superfamily